MSGTSVSAREPSQLSFYSPLTAVEVNNLAQAAADPSPSDPHAVFIHPPFTNFPDAHLHPEGLTFALMAAKSDWFLDPGDFVSPISPGKPDAVQYPSKLEPPRKRNLKALGADGLTEGGEPRFRCTFCRKSYAGDNAKSMWRRHVVKRHYIAMSNRREVRKGTRGGRRSGAQNSLSGRGDGDEFSDGSDDKGSMDEGHDDMSADTSQTPEAMSTSTSISIPPRPKPHRPTPTQEPAPPSVHRTIIPGTHTIKWSNDPIPPSQLPQHEPTPPFNRNAAAAFVGAAIRQMAERAYYNGREESPGSEDGHGVGVGSSRLDPLAPPPSQSAFRLRRVDSSWTTANS